MIFDKLFSRRSIENPQVPLSAENAIDDLFGNERGKTVSPDIHLTKPPYIFFSSTKSEFIRFIKHMQEDKVDNWQAFDGAKRIVVNTSTSYSGKYEDNLVYKF